MLALPLPRLARGRSLLTLVALAAIPLVVLWALSQGLTAAEMFPDREVSPDLAPGRAALALALEAPAVLAALWTLLSLRALFAAFGRGEALTARTARLIRRIGQGLLLLAVLPVLTGPLQSVLLTWDNPPGERMLAIALSSSELGFALAAGLMVLIGAALDEGVRAADEMRGFV